MTPRGEEFMNSIGNDKPGHEFYDDTDFEEVEEPIITRYRDAQNIIEKGGQNKMVSLKETAQAYEPKTTMNIADLEKVDISLELQDRKGTDGEGKEFDYKVLVIDGKEYRTPNTVIEEIKKIISLKPDVKFVKVTKQGSGLSTRYSVDVTE